MSEAWCDMSLEEALKIYDAVRKFEHPPTNPIVLSRAQLKLAREGMPKKAACIALRVIEVEGGHVPFDEWKKLCEID